MTPSFLRKLILKITNKDQWETYFSFSLLNSTFKSLYSVGKVFEDKDIHTRQNHIRNYLINQYKREKILFIEFGVMRGAFTNLVSETNNNKNSRIIGFDSFEGLNQPWAGNQIGAFSTNGEIPKTTDPRVSYVKGWFQNTVKANLEKLSFSNYDQVIVSFDADLYSSTLYCLIELNDVLDSYIAIFDEFAPDECRALYDYIMPYGASVEFKARSGSKELPNKVICKIKNCKTGQYTI